MFDQLLIFITKCDLQIVSLNIKLSFEDKLIFFH